MGKPVCSSNSIGSPHGERHALGRFEDESVAAGDGVGQKPERNHAGKIKWRDRGDHAERLADHHFVDAAGDVFEVVALHHHRNAAGDFDVFDGAAQFGFGLGKRLAVFLGDDAAEFVNVIFQKLLQFEERLDAVFGRSASPFGIGAAAASTGGGDFGGIQSGVLAMISPVAGLMTSTPFGGGGFDPLAVDVVWDFGYGGAAIGIWYLAETAFCCAVEPINRTGETLVLRVLG